MSSRFIPAALAGMVTIALVGAVLYGVVFADLFQANMGSATGVMKSPPDLLWVGLAHVPFGVLLTLVVAWRGATSARGGASTGATLGFLMAASYDLSQYGYHQPLDVETDAHRAADHHGNGGGGGCCGGHGTRVAIRHEGEAAGEPGGEGVPQGA